jgi:hypothetical protein
MVTAWRKNGCDVPTDPKDWDIVGDDGDWEYADYGTFAMEDLMRYKHIHCIAPYHWRFLGDLVTHGFLAVDGDTDSGFSIEALSRLYACVETGWVVCAYKKRDAVLKE